METQTDNMLTQTPEIDLHQNDGKTVASSTVTSSTTNCALIFGAGVATGLLAMYFLDPTHGRRRWSLVRDKSLKFGRKTAIYSTKYARHLRNRAQGFKAMMSHPVPDREALAPEHRY